MNKTLLQQLAVNLELVAVRENGSVEVVDLSKIGELKLKQVKY